MGWRDGTIRDVMAAEMIEADDMLAEMDRILAEKTQETMLRLFEAAVVGELGVIEASFRDTTAHPGRDLFPQLPERVDREEAQAERDVSQRGETAQRRTETQ